ncbi:transmembrane protein [Anaeramoeba ignava]|uniref:Transmembrane protein n=1 Tax=Anaeramoeba ignava TaxID=1746090 RepID=A0A9Q0R8F6_ANAIG|nr:transmembrane protein [Anaeramoeba ignava]|eukprot:Anaeramoba_ignava/a485510_36.p1 GENE.a485510_36~~a485510_36.p1  ORF type:complete len:542 (+),score=152.64 a485510_36:117-1742(+)
MENSNENDSNLNQDKTNDRIREDTKIGVTYGKWTTLTYFFNMIIGAGILTIPVGFQKSGLILAPIFMVFVSFLSYITVTYMVEVQASGNAIAKHLEKEEKQEENTINSGNSGKKEKTIEDETDSENSETQRLIEPNNSKITKEDMESDSSKNKKENQEEELLGEEKQKLKKYEDSEFSITKRLEMGYLSELFLGKTGVIIFYIALVLYLYGCLSIYSVSVPTTLSRVISSFSMGKLHFSEYNSYYLYLTIFALVTIPWAFFRFQNTKILQLFTMSLRNVCIFTMIVLLITYISDGKGADPKNLKWFSVGGLPNLFGASIFSMMCHHSISGLISPVRNKRKINTYVLVDFIVITLIYILLALFAVLSFGDVTKSKCGSDPGPPCKIQPLITLNFSSYHIRFFANFLALFPVFTLTTNFPMMAITLKFNIEIIVTRRFKCKSWVRPFFALAAAIPPIIIAFSTRNIGFLVNLTGNYAGLIIMFPIPSLLLWASRRKLKKILGHSHPENIHKTPFKHDFWVWLILGWSLFCFGLATYNVATGNF